MPFLPGLLAAALVPAAWAADPPRAAHPPARPAAHPPAASAASAAPRRIGKFDDWTAATHAEGGQTVCYAFTVPQNSAPAVPGRGSVVLTVTERPGGRDAVALSAGFAYAAGAEVQMTVEKQDLPFYTSARSAFAKDGHAVTTAFAGARQAVAKSPNPKGGPGSGPGGNTVSDTFSLRGFPAAYAAINKACPPK